MKHILIVSLLVGVACAFGGSAQWTKIQNLQDAVHCTSGTGVGCAVDFSATLAGDAGFMWVALGGVTTTSPAAPTTCGTWTKQVSIPSSNPTLVGYSAVNLPAGCTSETVTVTSGTGRLAGFQEFSSSPNNTVAIFDNSGVNNYSGSSCTSCTGASLTLTGGNDVISTALVNGIVSAIGGSYTGFLVTSNRAQAYILNSIVGTAPNWTSSGATSYQTGSMAISAGNMRHRVVSGSLMRRLQILGLIEGE